MLQDFFFFALSSLFRMAGKCRAEKLKLFTSYRFCVCYLHMQMQTLCRAVEISITTSYSTSVKMFLWRFD